MRNVLTGLGVLLVGGIAEPYGDGSALHIRSASRVGYSDLGVNGRRVRRIQNALEEWL